MAVCDRYGYPRLEDSDSCNAVVFVFGMRGEEACETGSGATAELAAAKAS
jgi:hypothetical protein